MKIITRCISCEDNLYN